MASRIVDIVTGSINQGVTQVAADIILNSAPSITVVGSIAAGFGKVIINATATNPTAPGSGNYAYYSIYVNPLTGALTTVNGTAYAAASLGAFLTAYPPTVAANLPATPATTTGTYNGVANTVVTLVPIFLGVTNGTSINPYADGFAQPVTQW